MSNDELAKIRQEIKESVLTDDLRQHLDLYGDDINLPLDVQQEGWDEPAYNRDGWAAARAQPGRVVSDRPGAEGEEVGDTGFSVDPGWRAISQGRASWPSLSDEKREAYLTSLRRWMPVRGGKFPETEGPYRLEDPRAHRPDPVQTTTDPVQTTTDPVQTTTDPVETTADPVETTADPVETTAFSRDSGMGAAYKGDTWDDLTGDTYNRDPDGPNLWESKSATVRGWIIENFKPLRSDGYDPQRIVRVLNERPETELTPTMLRWFHENKKQLQKDGYDFDLVVDKLNED